MDLLWNWHCARPLRGEEWGMRHVFGNEETIMEWENTCNKTKIMYLFSELACCYSSNDLRTLNMCACVCVLYVHKLMGRRPYLKPLNTSVETSSDCFVGKDDRCSHLKSNQHPSTCAIRTPAPSQQPLHLLPPSPSTLACTVAGDSGNTTGRSC